MSALRTIARSFLGGGTLPLIALAAIVGAFALGYGKGRLDASAAARVAALQAEVDGLKRDRDAAEKARDLARQAADRLAVAATENLEKVQRYEEELARREPPVAGAPPRCPRACALGADDLERLRSIR